jgi:DNA polymerase, archaea type
LGLYVAWDLEWDGDQNDLIEAISFVDSNGNSEVKFRDRDFNGSEKDLLRYLMVKIIQYKWSLGWNTQGDFENRSSAKIFDLSILHKRCKINGIKSIVDIGQWGLPHFRGDHQHIDMLTIFNKSMVQTGMYSGKYRTCKLSDVSKSLLGLGKYKDYSGADYKSLPIEEKIQYCIRDSDLVMQLSKHNNFEVLDALFAIADITLLDFEEVCKTNLSKWWGSIFNYMVEEGECKRPSKFPPSQSYRGADVLIPKKGIYFNSLVVDAQSLYPSVGIKYNISFDTINCKCCKDCLHRRIKNMFPKEIVKELVFVKPEDWLCEKKVGAFPAKLTIFKKKRLEEKAKGNKAMDRAFKILINGGYGVFGNSDFAFYDPRVAELVTAAGRCELANMQDIANHEYGFEIIYGDTDSLFLNNTSSDKLKAFQEKFKKEHDIELEVKNNYDKLLLTSNKKHYVGYEKGVIDVVGLEGDKSDRPEFYHKVFDQLVDDIIKYEVDPLPHLRKWFSDLDSKQIVDQGLLKIFKKLNKDLNEYKHKEGEESTAQIYKIGKALGAKKGDLVGYFSANEKETGKSWTTNFADADIPHYKELLWNTIYKVLEAAKYSLPELAKEFDVCIDNDTGQAKQKPKPKPKPESKPTSSSKKKRSKDNSIESSQKIGTGGERN